MPAVLQLREVSKQFPTHVAVQNLNLEVERGKLFALLGPSGCGKTTTLRMVAGFEQPTTGQVLLNGEDIACRKPYERNVSTVFQNYALFPHMTARENIEFGLRRRKGRANNDISRRVDEVLDLVRMTGKGDRKPARLSGGEKQRIALARSLVVEPEILLLDEPLSALDPNLRKQVRNELKALQRRVGITFIIVTHDQEEAMAMADIIAVMHKGVLEQVGTPEDIYLRPQTRFVAGFLGAVNWLDTFGVRPEAIRVAPSANGKTRRAKVESAMFLGNCVHLEARLESGHALTAEISRLNGSYRRGDEVYLWWEERDELRLP
ncbi:MAG: ABC transporter ATP-binding protein [Bryobacterales bacterium]|nr:ABC transporter ATP-binding protein [Bryobacterales bacterium]